MRVLHIGKYFPPAPGGMESYLEELVVALGEEDVTSYILAHQWDKTEPSSINLSKNITVERVPTFGQLCYVPVAPTFPFHLLRALHKFRPDIIHVHMPNASGLWALLTTFNIPVVIHWHADTIFPPEKKLHNTLYKLYKPFESSLIKKASSIIATSRQYLEHSMPLRSHLDKCHIIPLGLEPKNLPSPSLKKIQETRATWLQDNTEALILCIGRFAYYKGFQNVISAMEKIENAHLVMVGEGEELASIKQQVSTHSLQNKISFAGRVSTDDLHNLLAAADIFCLPSIERTEAFGMVLLEAMHHSTPCISTSIKGSATSWVNKNGETGLVVSPNTISELADALLTLINDSKKREQFGAAGNERLHKQFHIAKTAKQIKKLYTETLSAKHCRVS